MRFLLSLFLTIFSSYIVVPIVPDVRDIVSVSYISPSDQCHVGIHCEKNETEGYTCSEDPSLMTRSTGRTANHLTDGFQNIGCDLGLQKENINRRSYRYINALAYNFSEPFGGEYVGITKIQV